MGLLDGIVGQVLGGQGGALGDAPGDNGQHAGLIEALMNHGGLGGLSGLLGHLQSGGLAGAVASWIGTGANQPVSGEQVQAALPGDLLAQLGSRLGLDPAQVANGLSQVLPGLVDKLSPTGSLPPSAGIQEALGGLLRSLGGKGA